MIDEEEIEPDEETEEEEDELIPGSGRRGLLPIER